LVSPVRCNSLSCALHSWLSCSCAALRRGGRRPDVAHCFLSTRAAMRVAQVTLRRQQDDFERRRVRDHSGRLYIHRPRSLSCCVVPLRHHRDRRRTLTQELKVRAM
jgi:hypothetical protein